MSTTSIAVSIIDRGEAFDAETAARKIAPFGREQAFLKLVGIGAIGEQRRKAFLRHLEETLIAPERIIGVEGDGGDHRAAAAPDQYLSRLLTRFAIELIKRLRP